MNKSIDLLKREESRTNDTRAGAWIMVSPEQAIKDARLVGYETQNAWDAQEAVLDGYLMHLMQIWSRCMVIER